MSVLKPDQKQRKTAISGHGGEMLLFLVVSVVGIYGLGRGLTGLFEPSQGIDLIWLAVTGVSFLILFAQMGRIHDTWPHHQKDKAQKATDGNET